MNRSTWKYFTVVLAVIVIITLYAVITKLWVLTSIPIGFLFGFFLQKGDLCGSSAFSEVVLAKDWRKIGGLWVAIVVSMVGFALLNSIGWIKLAPKPMILWNQIVGGIIFGAGTVFAGGCVSGCLYKAGAGNLNSMAALAGMPFGISAVAYGPLHPLFLTLKKFVVRAPNGQVLSLPALTGLPYAFWAFLIGLITLATALWMKRKKPAAVPGMIPGKTSPRRWLTKPWKPWHAGVAIGILACFAYLSSAASGRNYPLGVTHGVLDVAVIATDSGYHSVYKTETKPTAITAKIEEENTVEKAQTAPQHSEKHVVWWLVGLVISLVIGSHVSGRFSGQTKLLPKPPEQTVIAFFGGILVGIGAALAIGCVIGNILSGWALMSLGTVVFGIVVVLSNWVTTYFYMMGGKLGR
jgi:hypothetical protein